MKHLQLKYSILHICFWLAYCCVYGYIAVFLRYQGMSNTLIGLTSGIACALTIATTPWLTGLVGKVKGLTLKKMMVTTNLCMVVLWAAMIYLKLPPVVLMICFIALANLIATNVPLLTTICMNYLTAGMDINFGLSRGMGSVSYATTAVVLGVLIERFNPTVLAYAYVAAMILLFLTLLSMPDVAHKKTGSGQTAISMFAFVMTYKVYLVILLGFALVFAASTSLGTYLINLVENLGGTTSLYGVGIFCMAASELLFMALTPALKRHFSTEQLLLFVGIMYLARNITICLAPTIPIMFFGMTLQGLSYGIFTASITYYVHERVALEHGMQGQTMIAVMTTGVGSNIGNMAGGMLQDNFGLPVMLIFCELLTVLGVAVVLGILIPQIKDGGRR